MTDADQKKIDDLFGGGGVTSEEPDPLAPSAPTDPLTSSSADPPPAPTPTPDPPAPTPTPEPPPAPPPAAAASPPPASPPPVAAAPPAAAAAAATPAAAAINSPTFQGRWRQLAGQMSDGDIELKVMVSDPTMEGKSMTSRHGK